MSKENSTKNIRTAFFLNLAFAFVELIGGIITNSVAILSDAVHDFGDSISLAIAWALQKKSNKAKDDKYSYGYKRFSLLSSVILSGILLVGSILIPRVLMVIPDLSSSLGPPAASFTISLPTTL